MGKRICQTTFERKRPSKYRIRVPAIVSSVSGWRCCVDKPAFQLAPRVSVLLNSDLPWPYYLYGAVCGVMESCPLLFYHLSHVFPSSKSWRTPDNICTARDRWTNSCSAFRIQLLVTRCSVWLLDWLRLNSTGGFFLVLLSFGFVVVCLGVLFGCLLHVHAA